MTVDAAIVDLDGTVYRGDRLLPGAERGLRAIRRAGVDRLFVTNNPTVPPATVADRLDALGIDATPGEILSSTTVARDFLLANHAEAGIFLVGESGVVDQLDGLALVDDPAGADALLAAIDRGFTYATLTDALYALRDGETPFYGTDPDRTIPTGDDDLLPGSGAIIGAIAAVAEREPDIVFGKPSDRMMDAALDRLGVDASSCLVVGDRLDTDVAMGERAGARTALVCTGTHDEATIGRYDSSPDHVLDSLGSIGELL